VAVGWGVGVGETAVSAIASGVVGVVQATAVSHTKTLKAQSHLVNITDSSHGSLWVNKQH
jgi:hypothetical protein